MSVVASSVSRESVAVVSRRRRSFHSVVFNAPRSRLSRLLVRECKSSVALR